MLPQSLLKLASATLWILMILLQATTVSAVDRETKVRDDRKLLETNAHWIYNDLPKAFDEAKKKDKPLLVVFRCIPCEACSTFDEQVVARDPRVRRLMDQFVCVRVPQANGMDLSRYQFDYDMSLAVFLMRADGTIYGRFGTRSGRTDEDHEMTIEGFAKALTRAIEMHDDFDNNKSTLAGKRGPDVAIAKPEEHAWLKGKYTDRLDYEGNVVKSCIHCHQVREAQRLTLRDAGQPIPDELMFPWPNPSLLGLRLDPAECATVKEVAAGSLAEKAGFQTGDEIQLVNGQRPVSIADVQWVLQAAKDGSDFRAVVKRGGKSTTLSIPLAAGWRKQADISWRATTWDLRRIALGGMLLVPATDQQRAGSKLPEDKLALHIKHLGQYGDHARAMQAGLKKDDIVVEFDGDASPRSESAIIAATMNSKRRGDKVTVVVVRDGKRMSFQVPIQ